MSINAHRELNSSTTQLVVLFTVFCLIAVIVAYGISVLDLKWSIYVFLGFTFPFLLVIVPDIRRFLLALLVFVIPLNIDYNFIWHPSPGGANALGITLVDVLMLFLLACWFVQASQTKIVGTIRFFPAISWPTLALIFFGLLSMLAASDILWSVNELVMYVRIFLFYLVLANNINNREDLVLVLNALFLGLLIQASFVTLQYYKGTTLGLYSIGIGEPPDVLEFEMRASNIARPGGTIGLCNHVARYFGLLLPVALILSLTDRSRGIRWFSSIVSVVGIVALIYTLTRSSWLSLIFSVVVMTPFIFIRQLVNLRVIAKVSLACVVLILLILPFRGLIVGRMTEDDFGSAHTRITTSKVALKIIKDHPLIGVGINNYGGVLERYWDVNDRFTRRAAVHNTPLLYMAELGILGFIAYAWLLIAGFVRIKRAIYSHSKFLSAVAIGILGSFVGFFTSGLAGKANKENGVLLFVFWGLLAITEAINRMNAEHERVAMDLLNDRKWIDEL